uniref:Uncharacterized protein n=1 Tax=Romanomermis culicivorax TaxID=13658 RepID=A0A915I0V3_ROMCU
MDRAIEETREIEISKQIDSMKATLETLALKELPYWEQFHLEITLLGIAHLGIAQLGIRSPGKFVRPFSFET